MIKRRRGEDQEGGRVFECKTCNRTFPTFQALGGHRTSHKKPRYDVHHHRLPASPPPVKPKKKVHECHVCGMEFAAGQALGGHMRRHKNVGGGGGGGFYRQSEGLCLDLQLCPPGDHYELEFLTLRLMEGLGSDHSEHKEEEKISPMYRDCSFLELCL